MNRSLLIAGGAVGAVALLEHQLGGGRRAGAANNAAAAYLALRAADFGVPFAVPASSSMVEAHRAFERALDRSDRSILFWIGLETLWLEAFRAGAAASPMDYSIVGRDLAELEPDARNWLDNLSVIETEFCAANPSDITPLGRAVCDLLSHKIAPIEDEDRRAAVLAKTRELASAMDAADFVRDGARRSENAYQWSSIGELPGRVLRGILPDLSDTVITLGMAAIAGLVIWKVATK